MRAAAIVPARACTNAALPLEVDVCLYASLARVLVLVILLVVQSQSRATLDRWASLNGLSRQVTDSFRRSGLSDSDSTLCQRCVPIWPPKASSDLPTLYLHSSSSESCSAEASRQLCSRQIWPVATTLDSRECGAGYSLHAATKLPRASKTNSLGCRPYTSAYGVILYIGTSGGKDTIFLL